MDDTAVGVLQRISRTARQFGSEHYPQDPLRRDNEIYICECKVYSPLPILLATRRLPIPRRACVKRSRALLPLYNLPLN